jgi:hypothetical protein
MDTVEQIAGSRQAAIPAAKVQAKSGKQERLQERLTKAAWLAILLGLVIESLLVLTRMGAFGSLEATAAEFLNRVSWAFLVCIGLAIGDALTEDRPLWLGLAGLAGAPIAFTVARGMHKGAAEMMNIAQPGDAIAPALAASIRGVEYMLLGLALFWLSRRKKQSIFSYAATALTIGLVFGALVMVLNPGVLGSVTKTLAWGVNELIFPVGCTLVIYATTALGKKVTA